MTTINIAFCARLRRLRGNQDSLKERDLSQPEAYRCRYLRRPVYAELKEGIILYVWVYVCMGVCMYECIICMGVSMHRCIYGCMYIV